MKSVLLFLLLIMFIPAAYADWVELSENEMSESYAQADQPDVDVDEMRTVALDNTQNQLMHALGLNSMQLQGLHYADNLTTTLEPDGSITFHLPDIDRIFVPNWLNAVDIEYLGVHLSGGTLNLSSN